MRIPLTLGPLVLLLALAACAHIQAINDSLMASSTPEGACEQGDADACNTLGWDTQEGRRAPPPVAAVWFERACDLGNKTACNSAGWHYHKGLAVDVDNVKAAAFFARACPPSTPTDGTLDEAAKYACGNLGYLAENGLGMAKDDVEAARLYGLACAGKMPSSCFSLGIGYERGRGVTQDLARARELYTFACDNGEAKGCTNLGVLLLDGRGGPFDLPRAHTLLNAQCSDHNDGWACTTLGYAFGNGVGVAIDGCTSRDLHEKACQAGNALGCGNLGANLLGKECDAGDPVRGRALVQVSCDEHGYACGSLGLALETGTPKDPLGAQAAYERGCTNNDSYACLRLGVRYRDGVDGPRDPVAALRFLTTACDLGRPTGCRDAVALAAKQKSPDLGRLKARACALGAGGCD